MAKPARAAIVHAVCDAKRNGCPFQPKEVKTIIREACIASGIPELVRTSLGSVLIGQTSARCRSPCYGRSCGKLTW